MDIQTLLDIARASKEPEIQVIADRLEKTYKESGIESMRFSMHPELLLEQLDIKFDQEAGTYTFNENANKDLFDKGIVSLKETLEGVESFLNRFPYEDGKDGVTEIFKEV
jgi:hypothetical protein